MPFEKLGGNENFVQLSVGMRMRIHAAFACRIIEDKKWFSCARIPSLNAEE